ncbi:putative damage-inducible protein DinB [Chitinophaga skermanii]|uniref:Putative damage-inducible protein DinB n=1 Tax=Chitinophaga skermanii TaxID=331697 RepID=A0A327Q336_9BACT|nr:DinB family protein [Chitinophaga skermanii]RAI98443.1 putative damage-inducible protein DinB [Chitinophaga skermanii]
MNDFLLRLANYNAWANGRLINILNGLPVDKLNQEIVSSFPTLRKTVIHMWNAERIWYQRIHLMEQIPPPTFDMEDTMEEINQQWASQSKAYIQFIEKATPQKLSHVYGYYNFQKQYFKLPVEVTLAHVFNHNTFHRGQLITMLRQVGVTKLPSTDMTTFALNIK